MNSPMPALRSIALWMIIACGIGVPLAAFPSVDIAKDVSNCFGEVLAWHHGHHECQPHYKNVESKRPAIPVIPALLVLALGACALRKWPRPLVAMAWSLGAVVLVIVSAAYTFDFEIFSFAHKTYRWSAAVLGLLYLGVGIGAGVMFFAMPVVMITRAIQIRRERREAIPAARVVRR